jgi:cytochrome c553
MVRTALAAAALSVSAAAGAADPAAGKAKFEPCLACHGSGPAPQGMVTPLLAAQPDNFLQWQLVFFRTETRKDPMMTPISQPLSNEDIRNIGAYLSSLPPLNSPPGEDERPDLTKAGEQLAKANHCASCHLDGFVGKDATPRLAGQREAYLLKALRDFKSGARRGGGIAAMPDAVYPLSDEGLRALAHFLSRLR